MAIEALKEGLELARDVCIKLHMAPHSRVPLAAKQWWVSPWIVEGETWKDVVGNIANLPSQAEDV